MRQREIVVIIPAFSEKNSIARVLTDIPLYLVSEIVVITQNASSQTARISEMLGATVLEEKKKGYGSACLRGLHYLEMRERTPDVVVFLNADYRDHPEEMRKLVMPIFETDVEMVIGSRTANSGRGNSLFNRAAMFMINKLYGFEYTDVGPFRAIKYSALKRLHLADTSAGWLAEMQLKAAKYKLKVMEIPVVYRQAHHTTAVENSMPNLPISTIKAVFKYALLPAPKAHRYFHENMQQGISCNDERMLSGIGN